MKKNATNTFFLISILIICAVFLIVTGKFDFNRNYEPFSFKLYSMDTDATIKIYDDGDFVADAVFAAVDRLVELEGILDYYNPDSELSKINALAYEEAVFVSDTMADIIHISLNYCKLTNGAFDISLGLLIETANSSLAQHLSYKNILFDKENSTVRFANEHIKMHFGAIAKGYAVDEMLRVLRERGVESAIIEFGGEIGVIGKSPSRKDGLWKIGIRNPLGSDVPIETVMLKAGTVATSGTYERGEHIFDPDTGLAAKSKFLSVTVIGDTCASADALSTAIFVNEQILKQVGNKYCVIVVEKQGKVTYNHINNCHLCVNGGGNNGVIAD